MIPDQERQRALQADNWNRKNVLLLVLSTAFAFIQYQVLKSTLSTRFIDLQVMYENSPSSSIATRISLFLIYGFLIVAIGKRIKTIESVANSWDEALGLGRKQMVIARLVTTASVVLFVIEVILFYLALMKGK